MKQDFTFREEPGWTGAFTRNEELGAIRNGLRIVKVMSEPGDTHPLGAMGTVLGSFRHPKAPAGLVLYFIEWDANPRVAVAVIGNKIEVPIS